MRWNQTNPILFKVLIILAEILLPLFSTQAQDRGKYGFLNKSTTMQQGWELGKENNKGLFLLSAYRPVYIAPVRWTNNPNEKPTSENPINSLPFKIPYNNYECKFQLSLKTKIARNLFWGKGDVWATYTQITYWQLYNTKLSRSIREVNYEPEIILNFATAYKLLGFNGKMIGIIFNHQSNGKQLPVSRGWNRIILQAGFETGNWKLLLRPSYRIKDATDGNPKIADYIGRAEAILVYNSRKQQLSAVMAHSMKFKNGGRGSIQLNWVKPVINNFKLMLQLFHGYGETLIDYNHLQTSIVVGVSFIAW